MAKVLSIDPSLFYSHIYIIKNFSILIRGIYDESVEYIIYTYFVYMINSQIADLKNAYKGVVKIITYKADGTILRDGTGVFLNKEGQNLIRR